MERTNLKVSLFLCENLLHVCGGGLGPRGKHAYIVPVFFRDKQGVFWGARGRFRNREVGKRGGFHPYLLNIWLAVDGFRTYCHQDVVTYQ